MKSLFLPHRDVSPCTTCVPLLQSVWSDGNSLSAMMWRKWKSGPSFLSISPPTGPICGLSGPLTSDSSINCTNGLQMYFVYSHTELPCLTLSCTWCKGLLHSHIHDLKQLEEKVEQGHAEHKTIKHLFAVFKRGVVIHSPDFFAGSLSEMYVSIFCPVQAKCNCAHGWNFLCHYFKIQVKIFFFYRISRISIYLSIHPSIHF